MRRSSWRGSSSVSVFGRILDVSGPFECVVSVVGYKWKRSPAVDCQRPDVDPAQRVIMQAFRAGLIRRYDFRLCNILEFRTTGLGAVLDPTLR